MKSFKILSILGLLLFFGLPLLAGNAQVRVNYTRPVNNGGAPITGYIIEKQPIIGDWLRVMQVYDGNILSVMVTNLEQTIYSFRVIAVNKYGESKPSEPSEYIDLTENLEGEVNLRCKDGAEGKGRMLDVAPSFELPNFIQPINSSEVKIPFRVQ